MSAVRKQTLAGKIARARAIIAMAFIELNPGFALRKVKGCGDLIADIDLEAHWIAFHAARATYQLLCRSCNSRKGAR